MKTILFRSRLSGAVKVSQARNPDRGPQESLDRALQFAEYGDAWLSHPEFSKII